jgi:hypothetical protein
MRLHGPHLDTSRPGDVVSANLCVICGRPTQDGYADMACVRRTGQRLAEIIQFTPDARAFAAGLVRHGGGGGPGGKPGSRSPGNDGAMDVMDAVQNALTTIAREIAETRGLTLGRDGHASPLRSTLPGERAELVPASTPENLEAS